MIYVYMRSCADNSYKELHKAAYCLLFGALRKNYGIIADESDILFTERGKPYFEKYPVHFNITHCKGCAACAVSEYPVGIDCETLRKYHERTVLKAFSEKEYELIKHSDSPDEMFSRLWTLKESYVKYTGTGLAGHLRDVSFPEFDIFSENIAADGTDAYFFHKKTGDVFLSVCTAESAGVNLNILP